MQFTRFYPVFLAILLLCALLLGFSDAGAMAPLDDGPLYRALIHSVDEAAPADGMEGYAVQTAEIEILEGPYRGMYSEMDNMLTGNPYYDLELEEGQRILVHTEHTGDSPTFHAADFVRSSTLYWLGGVFLLLLLAVGGMKGVKTLFSLLLMGVLVLFVLLPLLLAGHNPLAVTIPVTFAGALVFLVLVGGFNRKTAGAIGGTTVGLLFGGVLAAVAGSAAHLTGLSSSEAQVMQFIGPDIDFRGILFAGIILGALGAAVDVGMSIASSMDQIKKAHPAISRSRLIRRGFHVGRDVLGTMANTLILAYIGSSLPLLLLFHWQGIPWSQLMHLDLVASEVIRAMAGSIGLALAVPATALITGMLLHRPLPETEEAR